MTEDIMETFKKVLLIFAAIIGGFFFLVMIFASPPEGVSIDVDAPMKATVGETFTVRVAVHNVSKDAQVIENIDIDQQYLKGAMVIGSEPAFSGSQNILDGTRSFDFYVPIPPGEVGEVAFFIKAVQAGYFSGDFDVCVNSEMSCEFLNIATNIEP